MAHIIGYIGDTYTDLGVTNLKEITIPASVEDIGEFVFAGCEGLKDVVISNGVVTIRRENEEMIQNLKLVS